MDILILYSTTDGHTVAICNHLSALLRSQGLEVGVDKLGSVPDLSPGAVIIGASVRYGHHRPEVAAFMRQQRSWLAERPCALFSVNLTARKPGRGDAAGNPYLRRLLREIGWQPALSAAFAGKLDLVRARWLDRQMIRLIMAMSGTRTARDTVRVYTDWSAVDDYARAFARLLQDYRFR